MEYDIYNFLLEVDKDFPTPLSNKVNLEEYADKLQRCAVIFKATCGTTIMGMVAMYCNDTTSKSAYIPLVATKKDYRGLGIGKSLIGGAVCFARKKGLKKIGIHTENPNALKLYASLGFKLIDDDIRKYLELEL